MPTIPAPLYALVGVTDVATEKARELPEMLAELELRRFEMPKVDAAKLDPRHFEMPKVERPTFEMSKVDVSKLDPRHLDLSKVELPKFELKLEMPKVEISGVAAYALEVAAKAEKTYEEMVVRGEQVVARVRGTEHVTAPVAKAAPAKPATKKPATRKPAAKKATKKPAKRVTPKATAPKA
jgi:hypothetical protein